MKIYTASFTTVTLHTAEFEADSLENAYEIAYRLEDSKFDNSDATYNENSMQVEEITE